MTAHCLPRASMGKLTFVNDFGHRDDDRCRARAKLTRRDATNSQRIAACRM